MSKPTIHWVSRPSSRRKHIELRRFLTIPRPEKCNAKKYLYKYCSCYLKMR